MFTEVLVESAGIHHPQTLYRASWNGGPNKQAIIDFVSATTEEGHPDFIPGRLRISTFDNDYTLRSEQPLYFQATHAGDTADKFAESLASWLASARHPDSDRPSKLVFHPMLELLDYLRANQFKVFIVFGGEIFFLRVFADEVYKIPPE
ncbi:MAG: hypothetical protein KJO60_10950 [Desulfofustis sp.]|nr:hypothetical protein [Desulfofustis sp.]